MPDHILEISDLRTYYHDRKTVLKAVDGVSLTLHQGQTIGIYQTDRNYFSLLGAHLTN